MLELGEKRGGREFEKAGQKVQAAVMRHLNENVFHAGLCLYTLSDNGGHEDEARRTLGKRPEERIERGEYRFLALELIETLQELEVLLPTFIILFFHLLIVITIHAYINLKWCKLRVLLVAVQHELLTSLSSVGILRMVFRIC